MRHPLVLRHRHRRSGSGFPSRPGGQPCGPPNRAGLAGGPQGNDADVTTRGDRLLVDGEGAGRLRAVGEIDVSTAGMFRRRILALEHPVVHVDLSSVRFIDSSGLRVLLASHAELAAVGRRLEIVRPSGPVRRLLELTALDRHLHVVEEPAAVDERDRGFPSGARTLGS